MINNKKIEAELRELAKLDVLLHANGGPEGDGPLFEKVISKWDDILSQFGLPSSPENESLLYFNEMPSKAEIKRRIQALHQKAKDYLTGDVKSDLQLMRQAQGCQLSAFEVLPELKVVTHDYTMFIYHEVLLNYYDTPENVLNELMICKKGGLLSAIAKIANTYPCDLEECHSLIELAGLTYVQHYMAHKSGLLTNEDIFSNSDSFKEQGSES